MNSVVQCIYTHVRTYFIEIIKQVEGNLKKKRISVHFNPSEDRHKLANYTNLSSKLIIWKKHADNTNFVFEISHTRTHVFGKQVVKAYVKYDI